jgi:hypothetical protein
VWYGGVRLPAQILAQASEPSLDVALLAVTIAGEWTCCPLVATPPASAPVVITGYPRGERQVRHGEADCRRGLAPGVLVDLGDSGAPCVVSKLGCVGIVSGRRTDQPNVVVFTPSDQITSWLSGRGYRLTCPSSPAPPATAALPRVPDSPTCACDRQQLAALAAEVSRLRALTFSVQTLTPDGRVFSEDTVRLGDPIQFRLVPKAKGTHAPSSSRP